MSIHPHVIAALITDEEDINDFNFALSPLTNYPYIITFIPNGEHFQDTVNVVLAKLPGYRYIPATMCLQVYGRGTVVFFYQPNMEYFVKKVVPKAFIDKVSIQSLWANILNRFCPLASDILVISSKDLEILRTCCLIGLHRILEVDITTKPASYVRYSK